MNFFCEEGGRGGILGENFSRSGEGMSKFLASVVGEYMSDIQDVRSYQNMFKNYLYEKILP